VNNTNIFGRLTSRQTQFLVYQMTYESPGENAMILPLPVRLPVREESLRFIDLENYSDFFDDLDKGFPFEEELFNIGCGGEIKSAVPADLEVFNVGNYIASFVPSMADFSRLDPRFTLPQATWDKIPEYRDFGFAVFQLAAGSLAPHPMAFEFEAAGDSIFFPTVHIHDGEIHESEQFDHILYLQHAGFDSRVHGYLNSHIADDSTGLIRSKYSAQDFCDPARSKGIVEGDLLVHRQLMQGPMPNKDTIIATTGDPLIPTFNWRPLLPYTPWVLGGTALAWFFARRSRIKSIAAEEKGAAG